MFVLFIALLCGAVTAQSGMTSEVAFSVGLTHDLLVPSSSRVVYDTVFTNIGSGYDTTTGEFTCPRSGYYVFQFHMLAMENKPSWIQIYKNGGYIASAYNRDYNGYASAGNSVILTLTKGDHVFIKTREATNGEPIGIYGRKNETYATFSGYMIATILPVG